MYGEKMLCGIESNCFIFSLAFDKYIFYKIVIISVWGKNY